MQSFTLTYSQVQTYFAIRIFGLVHLLGAVALSLFLDGPRDGLNPISIAILLLAFPLMGFWGTQLFRAAVEKKIFGHYVLTQRTLAIKRPGQARQFIARKDCIGYLPDPWTLCLRGKRTLRLNLPGMNKVLTDRIGNALVTLWWPCFEKGMAQNLVHSVSGHTPHEVRVSFLHSGDTSLPQLVFRRKQGALFTMVVYGTPLIAMGLFFNPSYWNQVLGRDPIISLFTHSFILGSVQALAFLVFSLYWVGLIRDAVQRRCHSKYYVLTRRGLSILAPKGGLTILRPDEYARYDPHSGELTKWNGRKMRLGGVLFGRPPLTRMVNLALTYWSIPKDPAIERATTNEHFLGMEFYIVIGIMFFENGTLSDGFSTNSLWVACCLAIAIGLMGIGHRLFMRETV